MTDHRTLSEAYIEDSFATLSSRAVVENLTYVKGDLTGFFSDAHFFFFNTDTPATGSGSMQ